tara:strand:+ start:223 stop:972 length:750 start_codon:yes stop_codon:yes gene_type:complete
MFFEVGKFQPTAYRNDVNNRWTDWSSALVVRQKSNADISKQLEMLQAFSSIDLSNSLQSDAQKKAFWINCYNALVQYSLSKDAYLYENKSAFYSLPLLKLKDIQLSLDDIEHGILRRSQLKYGFGYFTNPFSSSIEELLRIELRDPRIHFALNCGAKSCPPIRIYHPQKIEEELNKNSAEFLKKMSQHDNKNNILKTSALFKWFRGDFGSKAGILKLYHHYDILEVSKNPSLRYIEYDWTLTLHQYVED